MKTGQCFIVLLLILSGCYPDHPPLLLPEFHPQPFGKDPVCLQSHIDAFAAAAKAEMTVCDNGAVMEYKLQGVLFYAFDPGTCLRELTTTVLNSDCGFEGIIGGSSGNNLIRGEDFARAEFVRIVWPKQ
jgi:hypothetical protein